MTTAQTTRLPVLTARDYASDQDVRWCPGCGDYAILAQVRKVAAKMRLPREKTVFVSGIGCAARFPYYMNTYGFHSIHGRAPALATGIKLANPDLDVWVVSGDGDSLSIGASHLLHMLRRNLNVNHLLFNNRIYGLTKGQYSPTSEQGKKTKSTPLGSIDEPVNPVAIALAAEASFVARSIDVDKDLASVLERAARHVGTSFVEIYQDCNIFNHKAFAFATDRDVKEDHLLRLEHGKPMTFGVDRGKGIQLCGVRPTVVTLGAGITRDDLLVHDETDPILAALLSRMNHPHFPQPVGVIHALARPCYEHLLTEQIEQTIQQSGPATLDELFNAGDTYTIHNDAEPRHGLHES